jgi:hypothetical protein
MSLWVATLVLASCGGFGPSQPGCAAPQGTDSRTAGDATPLTVPRQELPGFCAPDDDDRPRRRLKALTENTGKQLAPRPALSCRHCSDGGGRKIPAPVVRSPRQLLYTLLKLRN